ncbi:MAG: hypothetical protein JXR14_00860 [Paracoccaceae bacterium]
MTKLLASNCEASKATCYGFSPKQLRITLKHKYRRAKTYKRDKILSVRKLEEGSDFNHQEAGILGASISDGMGPAGAMGGALGAQLAGAMLHQKKNVYEIAFEDGNIIAIEETSEFIQDALRKLIFEKQYEGKTVHDTFERHKFPHGIHIFLSIVTIGLWLPIWGLHYLFRSRKKYPSDQKVHDALDRQKFPHAAHIFVSCLTVGLWLPIWGLHYLFRSRTKYK